MLAIVVWSDWLVLQIPPGGGGGGRGIRHPPPHPLAQSGWEERERCEMLKYVAAMPEHPAEMKK